MHRPEPASGRETPLLAQAARQLRHYAAGSRQTFTLPFEFPLTATPFCLAVWRALARIPFGRTTTYGAMAEQLGTAPRAVGAALRLNPLPVLVPCHRVVAKAGLGGFSGTRLLAFKEFLLALEARNKS